VARRAGEVDVSPSWPRPFFTLTLGLATLLGLLYGLHGAARGAADAGPTQGAAWSAHPRTTPVGIDSPHTGEAALLSIPVVERVSATLGRGGTLARALEGLGLSARQSHRVAQALAAEIDPTRLSAATGLSAGLDADGQVRSVAVRSEPGHFVRWMDGEVERVELPVQVSVEHAEGQVVHSVGQALDGAPWSEELTLAFADIFQWDVDLLVDPRVGDRVRVVYEVETLGRIPADLPSFGKSAGTEGQPLRLGRVLAASFDGRVAQSTAYWVEGPEGGGNYFDATGTPLRKTFLKSPLNYRRISSGFSRARKNPVTRKVVPHHGVDFAAAPGTPVVAAADGRVIQAGWQGALGRAIRLRHGSEYVTVYGHLQGYARGIRGGAEVRQNQVIGFVGSSGRATGPHLHYTLIHRDRPVDPLRFRNPPVEPLAPALRPSFDRARLAWAPLLGADPLVAETTPSASALGAGRRGI